MRLVVISISTVPTVIKMHAIIVMILSLNFALSDIHTDIRMFLKTTTVDAPTLAALAAESNAFKTETGTKNALPMH